MTKPAYTVTARLSLPNFEAEKRYVTMETQLARREMAKAPGWLPFSLGGLVLRRQDWQEYVKRMEHYSGQLERSAREARTGLVPVVFRVASAQDSPDTRIMVRVVLEAGQILHGKKGPVRPVRVDGAPNQSNIPRLKSYPGFERLHVKISARNVQAEFSRLEEHDTAQLVGEVLYLDVRQGAQLNFVITSHNLPDGVRGEVQLPSWP